jgi:aspartate 1-decarboxylase
LLLSARCAEVEEVKVRNAGHEHRFVAYVIPSSILRAEAALREIEA